MHKKQKSAVATKEDMEKIGALFDRILITLPEKIFDLNRAMKDEILEHFDIKFEELRRDLLCGENYLHNKVSLKPDSWKK
jgi:hypothetical protein